MANRIAVVEDHGLIAHTLASALRARGHHIVQLDPAEREDHDLVAEVLRERAELALLDLDLGPRGDALPLIPALTAVDVRVLMVTGVSDRVRHAACVRAGALGVVSKSAGFDELTGAVEQALNGGSLLERAERDQLLAELREHEAAEQQRVAAFLRLTAREQEVLGLLMQGRSVDQVAEKFVVSVATVRSQVRSILTKLDAGSQLVAIARAREAGWVPPQER
jgi:two-component system, NarL family, nitrate/nitrite response regulator NarL